MLVEFEDINWIMGDSVLLYGVEPKFWDISTFDRGCQNRDGYVAAYWKGDET